MTNDGSYSYRYDGLTAFAPAILDMNKTGTSLSVKKEGDPPAGVERSSKKYEGTDGPIVPKL